MIPANDVLAQLPLLTWRGLEAPPYDVLAFSWENELAPRRVPYVDVDVHDDLGRKSAPLKARLYFCEVLQPGAFSVLWPQWLEAIKTGDPDYLGHPLLGTLRARVHTVGGELKAQVRDGVIIDVEWLETNEDPGTLSADLTTEFDVSAMAELADSNAAAVGVEYPDGSFATSLVDAWNQIQGQLFSLGLSVMGFINTTLADIEGMIEDVRALDDHNAWPALDSLMNMWNAVYRAQALIASTTRATSTRKLEVDTTLERFAKEVGNTLQDVLGLNIQALYTPVVPKGATLRYFTGK